MGITGQLNIDRTGIVAGEAVFFNTTGTVSTETSKPYHHIDYTWDFDDAENLYNVTKGPGAESNINKRGP